jgi:hypothetical protein
MDDRQACGWSSWEPSHMKVSLVMEVCRHLLNMDVIMTNDVNMYVYGHPD